MAAVWHTLTWYSEHSTTLWGYKVALHLGKLVTGDGRGFFFFFMEAGEVLPKETFFKLLQTNSKVTSKQRKKNKGKAPLDLS